MTAYRFQKGWQVLLVTISSIATQLTWRGLVRYDDGSQELVQGGQATLSASRVQENWPSAWVAKQNGTIDDWLIGFVNPPGVTDPKRGQTYAAAFLYDGSVGWTKLCAGYVYENHSVAMGEFVEPGPGGGEGYFVVGALKADTAPAGTTTFGAVANAIRKVYGFIWYYNCAAVVASRLLSVYVARPYGTRPTGFTGDANAWASATLTLTTGEEGSIFLNALEANGGFLSFNDNTTLTYANLTTAPQPFPLLITEGMSATAMNFVVIAGDAGDRDSIYVLYEEWVIM